MTMSDMYTQKAVTNASMDFVLNFPQGAIVVPPDKKFGVCENQADRWSAEWHRYSTTAIPLSLVAGPGSALTFGSPTAGPTGPTFPLFDTGTGQVGDGFPWVQNFTDTDLAQDGAPVKERWQFLVRALGFQVLDPYVLSGVAGPPATFAKNYDPWIDAYKDRIRRAIMQNLAPQVTFKDGPCTWILGLISDYPVPNAIVSSVNSSVGAGTGLQQLYPTRRAILAGPRDSIDQMTIELVAPNATVSFGNDTATPTVANLTVPVQVHTYGTRVKECDVDCVVSVLNMYTANQSNMLNAMNANPNSGTPG